MSEQSGQQGTSREQLQAQVLERASRDREFRQQLLQDPKGTLEEAFDVQIPEFITVEVVEESPSRIYLVLPPPPQEAGQELSDREMEVMAGGGIVQTASNCDTSQTTCTGCISPSTSTLLPGELC